MKVAFRELANGRFESGLAKLNQDCRWHDDYIDLTGPFRLGVPGVRGWGEALLIASLLKRDAVNLGMPVKVFADWHVCSILRKDPVFDALQGEDKKEGRPPLAILRQALTGKLLEKPFIPLSPEDRSSQPTDHHPRIGIAWASIDNNRCIPSKCVPLKQLLDTLAGINGEFISLQRNLEIADPDGLLRKFGARVVRDEVLETKSESSLDTLVETIRHLYGEHTKNWGERRCIRHAKKFARGRDECSIAKITPKPVGGTRINGRSSTSGNAIMR